MFGYVRPCKPQLRVCEYETYRAVYCGLCKQLGRQYGPFSRLTLSFDFTFLALLQMSVSDQKPAFEQKRCMLNPLRKQMCCGNCEELAFSAGAAMIMCYFKVLDNYQDGGFKERTLSLFCMPLAKSAYKGAADRYPGIAQVMYETISRQSVLEEEHCDSVDLACEPTAQALSGICGMLSENTDQKRVLQRFGYLLGRYIYMADALDDLEQDLRQRSYNPFLIKNNIQAPSPQALSHIREDAKGALYLTMGELSKTFSLLELYRFAPILENVVQLGLHDTVERILQPKETKADDRPL